MILRYPWCIVYPFMNSLFNTKLLLTVVAVFLLSACQLNDQLSIGKETAEPRIGYGQYYLHIKSLSNSELVSEINQQKLNRLNGLANTDIYLLLLHSLPNSPIHNSYTAKALLNDQLRNNASVNYDKADLAFIALLKDQLNQQLNLFQQLISEELLQEKLQKKQKDIISVLKQKVAQLEQQILQLKNIEKSISEHGQ